MHITSDCLLPTLPERLARARGDLAMGLPCLLTHNGARAVVVAVETLSQARFDALCQRFGMPELILTAQRAQAIIPAAATDPVVRLHPPAPAGLEWFKDLSDTQYDAGRRPAGPLHMIRTEQSPLHRLSIKLVKLAELLPAVAMFNVPDEINLDDMGFASLVADDALEALLRPPVLSQVSAVWVVCIFSAILMVRKSTTRLRLEYLIATGLRCRACIRPVSPAMC